MKVVLHHLQMRYEDGPLVLAGIDLTVDSGTSLAILGPSGAGKTTLLRVTAGLEAPTAGSILLNGVDVTRLSPSQRNLSFVGSPETAIDELTVSGNIALPLRLRGVAKRRIPEQVVPMAKLLGIEPLLEQRPPNLSAGQRQRMSLARALVTKPTLLLADEPFAHLDARTRTELQTELRSLQQREKMTLLFVTHDAREAEAVGDAAAVLIQGAIEQTGTIADLRRRPGSERVGELLQ